MEELDDYCNIKNILADLKEIERKNTYSDIKILIHSIEKDRIIRELQQEKRAKSESGT